MTNETKATHTPGVSATILTLTDDDGNVLERWNVEHDFGDVTKPVARAEMVRILVDAIAHAKAEGGRS